MASGAFAGRRVTVMGLGRFGGGVGVTRWLARQGACITVTDLESAEKLASSVEQLGGIEVVLRLGAHDERDFRDADLVVVNPAVKPTSRYLQAAERAGVPISTEINLFLERCRAECVGITGTVGKSTTTAMAGHVLERTLIGRRTWVGGNIGVSLLDALERIDAADVVVLELSSFQLERTPRSGFAPRVAVFTNIAPNHTDWHGGFEAYVGAKLNLARAQSPRDGVLIADRSVELTRAIQGAELPAQKRWVFGVHDGAPAAWERAASSGGGAMEIHGPPTLRWGDCRLRPPGPHNLSNAAAALTIAHALGVPAAAASAALADFDGLPHRLQFVAEIDGVRYYNDSKGTTPEALDTAMNAFDGPLLLILGGYDKGTDLKPVMRRAAARSKLAVCIGATGPTIAETIRAAGGRAELADTLASAVTACRAATAPGDVVLLSPACASWGMFADYRARGDEFVRLVRHGE